MIPETLHDTLRRTAQEQVQLALTALKAEDQALGIHDARKAVKRLRALLRLGREGMGGSFRAEDVALRDINRGLSSLRDAEAVLEAVLALGKPSHLSPSELQPTLDPSLEALRAQLSGPPADLRDALNEAYGAVTALAARLSAWSLGRRWKDIEPGLRRTYRRGREAWQRSRVSRRTEDLHAWRKEVKHLAFQLRVLQASWPGLIGAWVDELGDLADLLGDDHDLAVLSTRLEPEQPDSGLRERIVQRRTDLQSHAMALGLRLYADGPRAVTRRVQRWVEQGQRAPLPLPPEALTAPPDPAPAEPALEQAPSAQAAPDTDLSAPELYEPPDPDKAPSAS